MLIQILKIDDAKKFEDAVLSEIDILKDNLSGIFSNSNEIVLQNLINETNNEFAVRIHDSSISFEQKHNFLKSLIEKWLSIWEIYEDYPEDSEIVKKISNITDHITGYYYLIDSLYLINKERTGDYDEDLARLTEGLCLLSDVVEVFYSFLSDYGKIKIFDFIKSCISSFPSRSPNEYLSSAKRSFLKTQLKGFCALIISNLEEEAIKIKNPINSSNSLYLDKEILDYMEHQQEEFNKVTTELQRQYSGKYILFENGEVIDSDLDEDILLDRVWRSNFVKQRSSIFVKKVPCKEIVNA